MLAVCAHAAHGVRMRNTNNSNREDSRHALKDELLRMRYGHAGTKRGRVVYRVSGNIFKLDGISGDDFDLWGVVDALCPKSA